MLQVTVFFRPTVFDDFVVSRAEVDDDANIDDIVNAAVLQDEVAFECGIDKTREEMAEDVLADGYDLIAIVRGYISWDDFLY